MNVHYNVWNISHKDFPLEGSVHDQIRFVLQYAVLAPSTHNIQPWLFRVGEEICDFLFDPKARLPYGDKEQRYAMISIGAALENFIIACRAFQMNPTIQYTPNEEVVARVTVEKSLGFNPESEDVLGAIIDRVNVRGVFEKRSISNEIIDVYKKTIDTENCTVHFCTDIERITGAAEATAQGLRKAHGNKSFRQEMAHHIISNISKSPVGIPGYTMNLPLLFSLIVPKIIYHCDLSAVLAKLNFKSVVSAGVVCIVTTKYWNKKSWIEAGQISERIILEGQSRKISSSVYVAATEFEDTTKKIQTMLKTDEKPVFLFCMGYMKKKYRHAQRLTSEEKIIPLS